MIKFESTEVVGWEAAIRGMRNPMNSWEKGDSGYGCNDGQLEFCRDCPVPGVEGCNVDPDYIVGPNDHKLMMSLAKGGSVHAKYRRMIVAYVDITAPLYWWKEFDTYKVGTVANSCSTMHKIAEKEFTLDDFSCEHLIDDWNKTDDYGAYGGLFSCTAKRILESLIEALNFYRDKFLETKDKKYWRQMIQLLPSSYNQRRTVMLNYEVLVGIYPMRKDHKLDEWHDFCDWINSLPYSEIITGEEK